MSDAEAEVRWPGADRQPSEDGRPGADGRPAGDGADARAEIEEPLPAPEEPPAEAPPLPPAPLDFTGTAADGPEGNPVPLVAVIEALLFLASDPLTLPELADATQAATDDVALALAVLAGQYADGRRGLRLREVAGGHTLATDPRVEPAARRLLARPRSPSLSPAQSETLAIVAYLQPVSRPEMSRIRGVSADSAVATLLERGLLEEAGRSPFGAVLYRTTTLFLKLFGLPSLQDLPDPSRWDPTPEETGELRERLLRAGEARAGLGPRPE